MLFVSQGPNISHLEEAVHVGLHVGDGHPLHDDVRDAPLQGLPFVASDSGGINSCGAPVRPGHTVTSFSCLYASVLNSGTLTHLETHHVPLGAVLLEEYMRPEGGRWAES